VTGDTPARDEQHPTNMSASVRDDRRVTRPNLFVTSLTITVAVGLSGCTAHSHHVSSPPPNASAATVAHTLMQAYQAGDAQTVRRLTAGTLQQLHPGDLGHVTAVHWRAPVPMKQTYPGFAPGSVYVSFVAATSGSPDQTIPPDKHWTWGFVLARKAAASRWVAVDDGVG
jgi:hypothetical protein